MLQGTSAGTLFPFAVIVDSVMAQPVMSAPALEHACSLAPSWKNSPRAAGLFERTAAPVPYYLLEECSTSTRRKKE
jgi:hypothetical protein